MKDCPKVIPQRAECPFRKFVIPASLGGSTGEYAPENGAYQNALVEYAADGTVFLYSSDGIPTQIPSGGDGTYDFNELLNRPKYAGEEMTSETDIPSVEDEISARQLADADLARGIDTLGDAITYEITARGDADTALRTAISDEATARATADTSLGNSISAETTNRENADQGLQSQIDAITASSDVTDIVGTKAELNSYDTSTLGDNDIIKVLQDESQNDETTYYRWSTTTETFTLIGEEGPYYTKSAADAQFVPQTRTVNGKALSANISLNAQDVGAQAAEAGKGLSTNDFTNADKTKLDGLANIKSIGDNLNLDANGELSATDTTYDDFTGTDGTSAGVAGLVPAPATTDAGKFLKGDGTWGEAGGGSINITTLTQNDYNWPENAPTGLRIGLLEPRVYKATEQLVGYRSEYTSDKITIPINSYIVVSGATDGTKRALAYDAVRLNNFLWNSSGAPISPDSTISHPYTILQSGMVLDYLTANDGRKPLSANQGRFLANMITGKNSSAGGGTSPIGDVTLGTGTTYTKRALTIFFSVAETGITTAANDWTTIGTYSSSWTAPAHETYGSCTVSDGTNYAAGILRVTTGRALQVKSPIAATEVYGNLSVPTTM